MDHYYLTHSSVHGYPHIWTWYNRNIHIAEPSSHRIIWITFCMYTKCKDFFFIWTRWLMNFLWSLKFKMIAGKSDLNLPQVCLLRHALQYSQQQGFSHEWTHSEYYKDNAEHRRTRYSCFFGIVEIIGLFSFGCGIDSNGRLHLIVVQQL